MKRWLIFGVIAIVLILAVSSIFIFNKSPEASEGIRSCLENEEIPEKNICILGLALELGDISICSSMENQDDVGICEFSYMIQVKEGEVELSEERIERMKGECAGGDYCLLNVARSARDSEICEEISDERIESECLIYTGGYSEDEIKQILLENNLNLDVNARIYGFYGLTGFSCKNIEFILQMMGDEDRLMRFKAVQRLGENQCSFVKLALKKEETLEKIKTAYLLEEDDYVKARIIHTLGELGGEETIPVIEEILEEISTSNFLKIACLTALGNLGGEESLNILNRYKENENNLISLNAQRAIDSIGNI